MGVYDDIIAKVEEPDRATLAKYPDLQKAIVKLEADFSDADTRLKGYETWYVANWVPERKMTRRELELADNLAAAEERAVALAGQGETEMTFDEILAQARPHIKTEVDGAVNPLRSILLDEKGQPKVTSRQDFDTALLGMQMFYGETANLPAQHFREFGADLDMKAYIRYVAENGMGARPQEAYDQFVSQKRNEARTATEKKREEDTKVQIEAARKEGAEQAKREMVVTAGRGTPSDAGVGASPLGPLAKRVQELRDPDKAKSSVATDPNIRLTDSRLSQIAAEEFFRKQMGAPAA